MVVVSLLENDRVDWALKTFKKKVLRAGILKELRRRRHYEKPSQVRNRKVAAAKRRRFLAAQPPRKRAPSKRGRR